MGTIDGYKIRRLTPLECFRLQGFPDEMLVTAKQLGIADTHLCTEKDIEDYNAWVKENSSDDDTIFLDEYI